MIWLKQQFKLPYILLISAMFFLAYFAVSDLRENRREKQFLLQHQLINSYGIKAARLVHQIQIERGLTAVAYSKPQAGDGSSLHQQRRLVDKYVEQLVDGQVYGSTILPKVLHIEVMQAITTIRNNIDSGSKGVEGIIVDYSNINKVLLDAIRRAVAELPTNQYDRISTYYYLLQCIEFSGIERAIVTGAMTSGKISPNREQVLWRAIENQRTYLKLYSMTAENRYRKKLLEIRQNEAFAKIAFIHSQMLDGSFSVTELVGSHSKIDAETWWDLTTARIGLLHQLSLDISTRLSEANDELLKQNNQEFYRKGVVYLLLGSLILGLLWLWISARYRSEELQKESRHRHNLALEGSGTAVWDYNVKADQLFFSPQWSGLMGLESTPQMLSWIQLQQQLSVPGFAEINEILHTHLSYAKRSNFEDRMIVNENDSQIWVNTCSRIAEYDNEDNPAIIVGTFTDISYRKDLEDNLRTSQQRLQFHLENSPLAVVEFNTQFCVTFWNRAAEKMFGYSSERAMGKRFDFIVPESTRKSMEVMCEEIISGVAGKSVPLLNQTQDGRVLQCQWNNTPLMTQCGRVNGFASIVEDITEQRQASMRQHRSQKMEALGSLTGGIAHDYNNVLGVILGYAEILQARLADAPELLRYAEQIYYAGERGAKLASNLLKFSKRQPQSQSVESLNRLIRNDEEMLNQSLTVSVDLNLQLNEQLWSVKIDAGGFEDMLFNLCINAKHAMPEGGKLTVTTNNCHLDAVLAKQLNLEVGEYVTLSVEDTGCGMNEDTLQRIFDPYFSTKGNKGTGLGLSQVYGFVQACGGVIDVFSQPGLGTRFVTYLPRHHDEVRYTFSTKKAPLIHKGDETILVVDDEASLCELVCLILERSGYQTLSASDAESALAILAEKSVDLMLSDVIMPKMNGFQLAEKVSRMYPKVQIRLASGFHEEASAHQAKYQPEHPVLSKPYDTDLLLRCIREQLDGANVASADSGQSLSGQSASGQSLSGQSLSGQSLSGLSASGQSLSTEVGETASVCSGSSEVVWTQSMSIDDGGELDKDHQVLLSLLNQCRQMANGSRDYSTLSTVVDELQGYTRYHFRREEMVMKKCNYPRYEEHCKIHNMLITKMQTIIESNDDGQIVNWLSEFLSQWLIEHIMVMDKAFVSYIEILQPQVQQALKEFGEVVE